MSTAEFDRFADRYKEIHRNVLGASGEDTDFFSEYKVKDTVSCIREKQFPQDPAVLDFGSGTGGSVPFFVQHLPECRLTCLDISAESLACAAKLYQEQAVFVRFDGHRLPFADQSFHVVFTACVFHHIPGELHEICVREIYRVLKPGGIFIAFEHNPYNFLTVRAVAACPFDEHAVLIRGAEFAGLMKRGKFIRTKLQYRLFFPRLFRVLRPLEKYMTSVPLGAQYFVAAERPL